MYMPYFVIGIHNRQYYTIYPIPKRCGPALQPPDGLLELRAATSGPSHALKEGAVLDAC
jgi:hypothetical protein